MQPADGGADKSVWRSGAHEFNSETSDGTWGFSQVRGRPHALCLSVPGKCFGREARTTHRTLSCLSWAGNTRTCRAATRRAPPRHELAHSGRSPPVAVTPVLLFSRTPFRLQFITVASLQSTPGLVVDDTLLVHGEVTLRWKRTSIDAALLLPSAAPPLPPPTDVSAPAPDAAASPLSPPDADGATQPATQLALHGVADTTATGLELPPALEAAYTRLVGCPSRAGGSLSGVLARAMAAQPPAGAAPSVLAVPEETAMWHRALSGLRGATSLSGAAIHPSWSGAWAVPLWRTLQQVHSGGSMHWQTLALAEGFITDVLVRLARAAHDVSAGTAAQPSAPGAAPGAKDTAAGAGAGAGGDDSGGESDDGGDSDSSSEDEAATPASVAAPPPAAAPATPAAAAGTTAIAPASQAAAGASRLDTAELALYEKIGGPPPAHSAAAEQQSGAAGASGAGAQPPISVVDVVAALSRVLPKELATHAALESRDALEAAAGLWRGPGPPPRPVVFDPDRCWQAAQALVQIPGSGTSMPALVPRGATSGARLYVAAVLEYMAAELLELSVDQALATGGTPPAKRASSEAGAPAGGAADSSAASSGAAPAAGAVTKHGGAVPFLLPCHCVQALRHDEELGMRTAALAAVPLAGVTYASLLGLFAPPQPAAKKALQKKKADAALDSAWQKELRRKQREAEKARKEREEKLKKEREKEKRRAEREAARKLDQERRARQQNSAAEQAAEIARQRLKERLAAVVDTSGAALGVAPPPADLRWPARSFLCSGRCRADGCADRDVFPDVPEGGVELTCSAQCSILYHGGFCWAGVSRTLLLEQRLATGGPSAPPSPGVGVGDDTVSEDGTGTAPPSEAGGDASAHCLLPRDVPCPTPGCSGTIVAAVRLDKAGRIDILAPRPASPAAAAGDDDAPTPGGTPGDGAAEVKKKKKRGSGATKLAAAEAAKAAAEAAKAAAEAAKAAAAQAAAQARAAAAAAAAERAAAEKAAADKAAATRAAALAAQKSSAASKPVPVPQQPALVTPPVAEKPAAEPSVDAATETAVAAAAPAPPESVKEPPPPDAPPPAAAVASAAKSGGPREVPDTWEDTLAGDDEAHRQQSAAAAAAPMASKAATPTAAAPPAKKGMSSAFGAITETLAALGLRGGGADSKTKAAAAAAAAALAATQKATAKEPPASAVFPAKQAAPVAAASTSSPKAKDAQPAPFADTSRNGKATQSPEQPGVPAAAAPVPAGPKANGALAAAPQSDVAPPPSVLGGALNALRHARRGVVTGVPQSMLVPGDHQPWVRDSLNAALAAHDNTSDMPCVAVTLAATTGTLMVDFATLQAAEAALGVAAERQLLIGGSHVRLQRLLGPPPGVPALDLRPPDASVTGRIDALIQSGQLQPAHITDRMWELLHVLDARTVLAALDDWPPNNGTLAAQDGAVALAALCQLQARTALLDLVALPGLTQAQAPQQVHHATTEPHLESGAAGYWAAPQVTGWGCDPPGLHYVSAAIHGRWLMCNAALRDRWNARRVCLGCGARLLQPHRQHCPLPGVAPPPGLPTSHFHTQQQQQMPRGMPGMQQALPGLGAALLAQVNGGGGLHALQQQQQRQAAPPPPPGLPRVPSGSNTQGLAWGPASMGGQGGRGGVGAPMGMSPPKGGHMPPSWHAAASHHGSGEPLQASGQWAQPGGTGQPLQPPLPSGPPPPRTGSGGNMQQHLQPPGPPASAASLPGRQVPRAPVATPASGGLGRTVPQPPPGAPQQQPPRQLASSSSAQHLGSSFGGHFGDGGGGAADGPEEEVCPICCEAVDQTDKAFFPCPCGFQPCMFCYNKIVEIGDARCPACRRTYGAGQDDASSSSSSSSSESDDSESDSDTGPAAGSSAKPAASRTGRQAVRMASRGA